MTASDNETTLSTSIEVSDYEEDGRFAVSSKTLLEALKEIPEQPLSFQINSSNLEITVQYQNGKYSLMGQSADEIPAGSRAQRRRRTGSHGSRHPDNRYQQKPLCYGRR